MSREVGEHVAGRGEADGVATRDRMMGDVLDDHRLADAVWPDEHAVMAGLQKSEAEELVDRLSVDLLWPRPIEVDHGLDGADAGVPQTPLEPALLPLALLDGEDLLQAMACRQSAPSTRSGRKGRAP